MKAIVFGGAGRIGRSLQFLHRDKFYPTDEFIFVNRNDLDLLDREKVRNFISRVKPDAVLNLAAILSVRVGEAQHNFQDFSRNLTMLSNIYEASIENGVKRIVQPGSFHCLTTGSPPPYSSWKEPNAMQLNFSSPYSSAKSAEVLFYHSRAAWLEDSRATFKLILLPNVFGPFGPEDLSRDHFIGATITRVISAKKSGDLSISAYGNPEELREYLFGLDAAKGMLDVLLSESETPDFSVLSSGHKYTLEECWQAITEEIGYSGRVVFDPLSTAPRRDMYFDTPTFEAQPFREQLSQTVRWYNDR